MNEGALVPRPGDSDGIGMLVHSVPVRVVEMSGGGCCAEATRSLPIGTAGHLRIPIEGVLHSDDFRIARCQKRVGASDIYHLGMEWLQTRRLTPRSLRLAIRRRIDGCPPRGLPPHEEALPAVEQPRDERRKGVSRAPPTCAVPATSRTRHFGR